MFRLKKPSVTDYFNFVHFTLLSWSACLSSSIIKNKYLVYFLLSLYLFPKLPFSHLTENQRVYIMKMGTPGMGNGIEVAAYESHTHHTIVSQEKTRALYKTLVNNCQLSCANIWKYSVFAKVSGSDVNGISLLTLTWALHLIHVHTLQPSPTNPVWKEGQQRGTSGVWCSSTPYPAKHGSHSVPSYILQFVFTDRQAVMYEILSIQLSGEMCLTQAEILKAHLNQHTQLNNIYKKHKYHNASWMWKQTG